MHVEPIEPALKPPGLRRLKLIHDELFSLFAFSFNARRYYEHYRGGSFFKVMFYGQGLTLVHCSAQVEPCLTQNTP